MADPKIVKEWLCKPDEDFNFAGVNLEEGNNFYTQICFHFQQAAEKALEYADRGYVFSIGKIAFEDKANNLLENDDVRKSFLGES